MKTEILGPGNQEPKFSIVYCIHGDEPCGKKAVDKLKNSKYGLNKPVKLVFANEEAYKENERYLETDLNRAFPGDEESELLEEKLATQIYQEVKNTKNLVIHSTHSQPTPFAIMSASQFDQRLAESTQVDWIGFYRDKQGSLECITDSVVVEAGPQGTEEATEQAYRCLLNFLSEYNLIDRQSDNKDSKYFLIKDKVEKTDYKFIRSNFEEVKEGEVFAKNGEDNLVAKNDFHPFLMSTNGYENMLGFKAEQIVDRERLKSLVDLETC